MVTNTAINSAIRNVTSGDMTAMAIDIAESGAGVIIQNLTTDIAVIENTTVTKNTMAIKNTTVMDMGTRT